MIQKPTILVTGIEIDADTFLKERFDEALLGQPESFVAAAMREALLSQVPPKTAMAVRLGTVFQLLQFSIALKTYMKGFVDAVKADMDEERQTLGNTQRVGPCDVPGELLSEMLSAMVQCFQYQMRKLYDDNGFELDGTKKVEVTA